MKIAVQAILDHYQQLAKNDDYNWLKWSSTRKRFSSDSAAAFFIGVMLGQGQVAERAWHGGEHFVANHIGKNKNVWKSILKMDYRTLKQICQKGYDGNSYAIRFSYTKFPKWIKKAAYLMNEKYDCDPRNIWKISNNNVNIIYDRFAEFEGIGDALAKMAQFILVRNYGVAGGKKARGLMSVKPDSLVRRVLYRAGLSCSEDIHESIKSINNLKLKSPADFDAATWIIGRELCLKSDPKCPSCPLINICNYKKCT